MTYKKKLIETALPLEAINAACRADKERKTGTIRNLHKWFAPMPVPALRAMIFAALIDTPEDEGERARLIRFIEELVSSGSSPPPKDVMRRARRLLEEQYQGQQLPLVVDPFCGGGSTLVEAQRLGLQSNGSDLNPIPVLISKVLTELPPQVVSHPRLHDRAGEFALENEGLSNFLADVQHYAESIYKEARHRLSDLYPTGPNGDRVVAWRWAWTVESPDPRFQGRRVPLVSTWWLSKQTSNKAWIQPLIDRAQGTIKYEIGYEGTAPEPSKSKCLLSGTPISFKYVREQGLEGRLDTILLAVVTHGKDGRRFFAADDAHRKAAAAAAPTEPPNATLPAPWGSFTVQGYGLTKWADLFLPRQMVMLETFAGLVAAVPDMVAADGGTAEYGRAIASVLGLCVGKLAQASSTVVRWNVRNGPPPKAEPAFSQQQISLMWDFAETNPFGGSVGDWIQVTKTATRAFEFVDPSGPPSKVGQSDARRAAELVDRCALIVTDPPYFSAIGYADLSDYFYVWVRMAMRSVYPDLFATIKTPKDGELIAAPAKHDTREAAKKYFVDGFTETFSTLKEAACDDLPILVVYAYKEQEVEEGGEVSSGWEAMLEAILRAGLSVVGTWPIWGSRPSRMIQTVYGGSNVLATYVLLVCRPRTSGDSRTTRREIAIELRQALAEAVPLMQSTAIAPVDLPQAVIGPGMSIFSKYETVLEPDGSRMSVRQALLLINRVLAEVIDEQEGELDADTRWAVAWFEQHGFEPGTFGDADSLARAKVTSVAGLTRAGIAASGRNQVKLLRREELPDDYAPEQDARRTAWEAVQHLVKRLDDKGEVEAASLYRRLGSSVDSAQHLAYRLHQICGRKGWTDEALAYNQLITSWSEIARLSSDAGTASSLFR